MTDEAAPLPDLDPDGLDRPFTIPSELPVLPLRDTVLFPNSFMPLAVAREASVRLIDEATASGRMIGVFTQREASTEEPLQEDLYTVGTATHIHKMFKLPDGSLRLIVQGLARVTLDRIVQTRPYLKAAVTAADEVLRDEDHLEIDALQRNIKSNFQQVVSLSPLLSDDLQALAANITDPGKLADFIASSLTTIGTSVKQEVLDTLDIRARMDSLNRLLIKELEVLELGSKIQSQVQSEVGKNQREYFLREQLKAIQKELGEGDEQAKEIEELRAKVESAGMPEGVKKEALRELDRLSKMPVAAAEYTVSRTHLDWIVALPWAKRTEDAIDLRRTKEVLDADGALTSGQRYFYIVKALDDKGNESAAAPEASAVPTYTINWANLQRPAALSYTVSAKDMTEQVYGQVYIEGVTRQGGPTLGLVAQVGYGPQHSDPREWVNWVAMDFHADVGNNDEFQATLQPTVAGTFSYLTRYSTDGETWIYADLDGIGDGSFAQQTNAPGTLSVVANQDQTPSAAPANLQATNKGATSIGLTWEAVSDSSLFRYEIYRSTTAGSDYLKIGRVDKDTTAFTDTGLQTGTRYYYVVRAVDEANNISPPSSETTAVPQPLPVEVTFEVEMPPGTPADRNVYIVGNQPEICEWCNPQTAALAKGEDGKWRVTITFQEGTPIEYKFTLGSWDSVEKDVTCNEVANRQVRAVPDANGTQTIRNTVANWRDTAPCGS